jgi:hypothetical protein
MVEEHHNIPTFLRQERPFPGVSRPHSGLWRSDSTEDTTPLLLRPVQCNSLDHLKHEYNAIFMSRDEWVRPSIEIFDVKTPTDDPVVNDIKAMCGFQNLNMDKKLVFYLHTKYVSSPEWESAPPDSPEQQFQSLALSIDKLEIDVRPRPASLASWRHLIVRTLLKEAEIDLLIDDEAGGIKATYEHHKPETYEELKKQYFRAIRFTLQRKRSKIAKVTRRGMGNTLVGSRSAIETLLTEIPESGRHQLKIVIFEDGEIADEPFILLGYNGGTPYDSSLLFGYNGDKIGGYGGFAVNDIAKYWKRIL